MIRLNTQTRSPKKSQPIYIIGAGGIVKDAHLPAYQIAGFEVAGITDLDASKAKALARDCGINMVYQSVAAMLESAPQNAVYDLAIPAKFFVEVLNQLPDHSAVLLQKPMGENLEQAKEIMQICKAKHLIAAVNFQLRFAPFIMMARDAIQQGLIGDLIDLEVKVSVDTPWHLWPFLKHVKSAEIYYHSVHYIDMIRSFLGNPKSILCKGMPSPSCPEVDCSRTSYILDYGPDVRVNIQTNHVHRFGPRHQESYVKWEGTKGAIKAQIGLLMDYPKGLPDWFEICILEDGKEPEWKELPVNGSWFPHGFIGTMSSLMCKLEDPSSDLPHSIEDVFSTMKAADAAERSSLAGGVDS
jgi:predicted dehydrogenase